MVLEHYTAKGWQYDPTRKYRTSPHDLKPVGLWVSVAGEEMAWPEWCEENSFAPHRLEEKHQVILKEDARVILLETAEEIREFSFLHTELLGHCAGRIDWTKLQEGGHQGILIPTYQWTMRYDPKAFWYYGWDCASGCIWDLDAIEKVEKL